MLTRYRKGSLLELLALALPLMLSSLSVLLFFIVDRCFLVAYSQEAFNAMVSTSSITSVFLFSGISFLSTSAVFVARYHGRGEKAMIPTVIWTLLPLALATALLFLPLAISLPNLLDLGLSERHYFQVIMIFGPVFALSAVVTGYYMGQGLVIRFALTTLGCQLFNCLLDYLLIFGWENGLPPLGLQGAALATGFSESILVASLLLPIVCRSPPTFQWRLLRESLSIGLPNAGFTFLQFAGWMVFFLSLRSLSSEDLAVGGMFQSFTILCLFYNEGIARALLIITGNRIGSQETYLIKSSTRRAGLLHFIFFLLLLLVPSVLHPAIVPFFLNVSSPTPSLISLVRTTLWLFPFFVFLDNLRGVLVALLTAATDTRYLFFTGSLILWIFFVLPVYAFAGTVVHAELIACLYTLTTTVLFWKRYRWILLGQVKSGKWA